MRLDLLLEREPFADFFSATLANFLKQHYGWQGDIVWKQKPENYRGMLVNAKLNLIFPAQCDTVSLRGLGAEYAHHPQFMRRILQQAYVHYALSRPLRRAFSSAWVDVLPWPEALSNWCILPGNHAIRIIDLVHNECIVLRKSHFNPALLENVTRMRKNFPELPGPRLLEDRSQLGWYREERVTGLPLNRLADPDTALQSLNAARQAMAGLYRLTLIMEPFSEWLDDRLQRITAAVAELPTVYGLEIRAKILNLAHKMSNWLRHHMQIESRMALPTALTHGDFQPANVLVPAMRKDGLVYLIDWEYTDRRCVWYDSLVFDLRSRFPMGLAKRVVEWLKDSSQQQASLAWCGDAAVGWKAENCIRIFLLEDLLLRLTDAKIPELQQQQSGFLCFLNEMRRLEVIGS